MLVWALWWILHELRAPWGQGWSLMYPFIQCSDWFMSIFSVSVEYTEPCKIRFPSFWFPVSFLTSLLNPFLPDSTCLSGEDSHQRPSRACVWRGTGLGIQALPAAPAGKETWRPQRKMGKEGRGGRDSVAPNSLTRHASRLLLWNAGLAF